MRLLILITATSLLVTANLSGAATVATVDGNEISDAMFEAFVAGRMRKSAADLAPQEKQVLTEELIRMHVISGEAEKQKLHKDPEVAMQLSLQRKSLLASSFLQRHMQDNPVTEQQLQAAYDERFGGAQREYKARHILVTSPTTAAEVIAKLDEGADFVALAAEYSTGPSASTGGDLGWFSADQMVKPFSDAVAAMDMGSHSSAPVQTQFGWHVIRKEEQRDLPAPDLASVKGELEQSVQQKSLQTLMQNLRDKADIKQSE